jgi:hypothetical protein
MTAQVRIWLRIYADAWQQLQLHWHAHPQHNKSGSGSTDSNDVPLATLVAPRQQGRALSTWSHARGSHTNLTAGAGAALRSWKPATSREWVEVNAPDFLHTTTLRPFKARSNRPGPRRGTRFRGPNGVALVHLEFLTIV